MRSISEAGSSASILRRSYGKVGRLPSSSSFESSLMLLIDSSSVVSDVCFGASASFVASKIENIKEGSAQGLKISHKIYKLVPSDEPGLVGVS